VVVGLVVFGIGALSLVAGSLMAARTMRDSRSLAAASIAAQSTVDSLKAVGFDGIGGAAGSYTVKGHAVAWSVSADDPRVVSVIVTRQTTPRLAQDTIRTLIGRVDVAR
jgi:Tfp pilus assembly protein PilV